MAKLRLDQQIMADEFNPLLQPVPGTVGASEPATLRSILVATLRGSCVGDDEPNTDEKMARYYLSNQIVKENDCDFGVQDLTLIRKCVENRMPQLLPFLFGQIILLLDGKETGLEHADQS